jgi:hypothetical protein
MKKMLAQWLTVHKADIDQDTAIEILWQTAPNTLNLLIFRISRCGNRATVAAEEIGPYHCLAELRQQLCVLYGAPAAQRICHPSSWLPPGIPATRTVPHSSHLAMTDAQPSEKVRHVPSHEHWTELA